MWQNIAWISFRYKRLEILCEIFLNKECIEELTKKKAEKSSDARNKEFKITIIVLE